MAIKKHDFIEIEYTGRLKDNNEVFDTTDKKVAHEAGIHNEEMKFGAVTVCVGEKQVIPGMDKSLEGKDIGSYKIEIKAEDAFGKKDAKLIQLISTNKFLKQKIQPMPGLQINIDGVMGTIKTVSGGRTLVDFNHPLSGRDLVYEIKINKIITETKEKIKSFIDVSTGITPSDVLVNEAIAEVKMKSELPKEVSDMISQKLKEILPEIKEIRFLAEKEKK